MKFKLTEWVKGIFSALAMAVIVLGGVIGGIFLGGAVENNLEVPAFFVIVLLLLALYYGRRLAKSKNISGSPLKRGLIMLGVTSALLALFYLIFNFILYVGQGRCPQKLGRTYLLSKKFCVMKQLGMNPVLRDEDTYYTIPERPID